MPGHLPAPCQGLVPEVGPSGVAARLVISPITATFRDMATVGYARVPDVPPSTNVSRERPRRPLPDRSKPTPGSVRGVDHRAAEQDGGDPVQRGYADQRVALHQQQVGVVAGPESTLAVAECAAGGTAGTQSGTHLIAGCCGLDGFALPSRQPTPDPVRFLRLQCVRAALHANHATRTDGLGDLLPLAVGRTTLAVCWEEQLGVDLPTGSVPLS